MKYALSLDYARVLLLTNSLWTYIIPCSCLSQSDYITADLAVHKNEVKLHLIRMGNQKQIIIPVFNKKKKIICGLTVAFRI